MSHTLRHFFRNGDVEDILDQFEAGTIQHALELASKQHWGESPPFPVEESPLQPVIRDPSSVYAQQYPQPQPHLPTHQPQYRQQQHHQQHHGGMVDYSEVFSDLLGGARPYGQQPMPQQQQQQRSQPPSRELLYRPSATAMQAVNRFHPASPAPLAGMVSDRKRQPDPLPQQSSGQSIGDGPSEKKKHKSTSRKADDEGSARALGLALDAASPDDMGNKQSKRQQDKAVRLYNYVNRLQNMRLHVQKMIQPHEYEQYVKVIRKYAEQELDVMLSLDYKDLCFAEETIEKKVKQLDEFFTLTNAKAFAWRRIGDMLTVSPAMCKYLDMSHDELIKLNFVEMIPREDLFDMTMNLFLRLHFYGNPRGIVRDVRIRHPRTQEILRFRASFTHVRDVFELPAMTFAIFIPLE